MSNMTSSLTPPVTVYGATTTSTLYTYYTVTSEEVDYTIEFPSTSGTQSVPYTTISTNAAGNIPPTSLPILVLTDVVGIAVSTNGEAVETATLIEQVASEASFTTVVTTTTATNVQPTNGSTTSVNVPCSGFSCWSQGDQAGIITGSVVGFLALLGLLWWAFCLVPNGIAVFRIRHSGRSRSSSASDNEETVLSTAEVVAVGPEAMPYIGTMTAPAYRVAQVCIISVVP